jgi:hypothetical protein
MTCPYPAIHCPCYPVIGIRACPGEASINVVYYCKLHPELGSTFLTEIEFHCKKEPDHHKAEILKHDPPKQGDQ